MTTEMLINSVFVMLVLVFMFVIDDWFESRKKKRIDQYRKEEYQRLKDLKKLCEDQKEALEIISNHESKLYGHDSVTETSWKFGKRFKKE